MTRPGSDISAQTAPAPRSPEAEAAKARPTIRQLARAITQLESGSVELPAILQDLRLKPKESFVVGITGPPGSGKSTLVDKLVKAIRHDDLTVAVVAVDPSSPFTGGALLGDRVRMMAHHKDSGVFIRSMAARRALGGLASATRDVAHLLTASGFDQVIIETVGVGQSELDIVKAADSVVVVTVPGLGDSVQTLKAGLLEIADMFVVNMADRPGVDRTVAELRSMLSLAAPMSSWTPPILETIATQDRGIEELWTAVKEHRAHLESSGELAQRRFRRTESEVMGLVERRLRLHLEQRLRREGRLAETLQAAIHGEIDPHTAAARIADAMGDADKGHEND
jgi:LAO/AO transport system kinase